MKRSSFLIILCLLIFHSSPIFSQQKQEFSAEELKRYEEKVRDITNFYFYLLNTVGSKETSPFEKEIIVTESYKKYFIDDEVQVEDDLDQHRQVPTNKNIAAYLKDVDFFFKNVRFDHEIDEVTQHVNEQGIPFFKVSLTRRLNGITVEGDTLNNTLERFIEVNITKKDQDLRIASIYTTKLSEKEDIINWWNQLNANWKEIFKDAINIEDDSLDFDQIKQIISLKEIDVEENMSVNTVEPLSKLSELESINISNTRIDDLSPLRNLTRIRYLNAANTKVDEIEALRYTFEMATLFLDNTLIDSINVMDNFKNLKLLSMQNAPVKDFSPLNANRSLRELYATGTYINTFAPLHKIASLNTLDVSFTTIDTLPDMSNLIELKVLDISNTNINNIEPVSVLKSLEEIRFDNTTITTLQPLKELNNLKRIYCDYTGISRTEAAAFMEENPGTLIIFSSDRLLEWWNHLSMEWRNALLANRPFLNKNSPSKEELAALTRIDSLQLSGRNLSDLEPLKTFHQLYALDISNNNITTLNVLSDFRQIKSLNISDNPIDDINILNELQELQVIKMEGLPVNSMAPLYNHDKLKLVYAENTNLDDEIIKVFNEENPRTLVIYKTDTLASWWKNLDEAWQNVFAQNAEFKGTPDKKSLHEIIFLEVFESNNNTITDITPLSILLSPTIIRLERLPANDLTPLKSHTSLKRLKISRMPVDDLSPLKNLTHLEQLVLSDTPLENLEPIAWLKTLKQLDLSSTQAKNIKYLKCLKNLEQLNIANTRVRRLKHLYNLEQLEELICYNTRISPREVEKFKRERPECRVVYYR
jgi:hypothetical protein